VSGTLRDPLGRACCTRIDLGSLGKPTLLCQRVIALAADTEDQRLIPNPPCGAAACGPISAWGLCSVASCLRIRA